MADQYRLARNSKSFVDVSLAFEPHPVTGDITVLKNERAINNAVKNIIMTSIGETPFNRDMGSSVSSYMFELFDEGTAGMISNEIDRAIRYNEPRVELESVDVEGQPDQNRFFCRVQYKIVGYEEIFTVDTILTPTR